MDSPIDERQRFHLAQLCRGFLLLREGDPDRATLFLRTFLDDIHRER